jgi:predicted PurR-regulated permease PerM
MASEIHAQRSLVFLLLLAVALVAVIVSPFWVPLLLAAVFGAALQGWMDGLSALFRGRRPLAALVLTVGVLLAVLLPLGGLGAVLTKEVLDGVQWVRNALASEGIDGLLHRLPDSVEQLVRRLVAAIPDPQSLLRSVAAAGGGETAQALGGFLVATGAAFFQAALFLIALYFFLTDGERLVVWVDGHAPLRPGQLRTFLGELRRTSVSVLVASLATAVIQTATGVVGYLIARAPNLLFLALATFVVALIPAAGGALMVVAVGLLLLATGHVLAGVFLVVWGAGVVSLVDNVVRPYLLRGGMALHGGLLFFALLGGLAVFGGIGLIIGPLALTFLVTALNMYRREFGPPGEAGAAEAAAAPSPSPLAVAKPEPAPPAGAVGTGKPPVG